MKKYFCLILTFVSIGCLAQAQVFPQRMVTFKNPAGLSAPKGYSHSAVIDMGKSKMIILSGQVALNQNGDLIGKGNIVKQTEQVFANIKRIIEDAGGNMNNVVKLTYYLKDVSKIQQVRDVRDKYINTKTPPASTLVEVSNLFRDDILIEIEATAVLPKA
jgi:2-iminobutanoate/2-iminopropanoate deaminase